MIGLNSFENSNDLLINTCIHIIYIAGWFPIKFFERRKYEFATFLNKHCHALKNNNKQETNKDNTDGRCPCGITSPRSVSLAISDP